MLSMIVIPFIIAVKNYLSMVNGLKFKTLYQCTPNITVKRFYLGIFLWSSNMGKFLLKAFILHELSYHACNELRAIVVS